MTLGPGSYAVVVGSDLFGASGYAGLGDGNATVGSPNFFSYLSYPGAPDAWDSYYADGARVVVEAAPEPSTWAMLIVGFAPLGVAALRRRRRAARLPDVSIAITIRQDSNRDYPVVNFH